MILRSSQHVDILLLVKQYCSDEETAKEITLELIRVLEEEDPEPA